jgi:hypothetical protein
LIGWLKVSNVDTQKSKNPDAATPGFSKKLSLKAQTA